MALTLAESAKFSQDALRRGVIELFFLESPVLDLLPLMDIQGNAYAYNEEQTLPGVAFRAVNTGYTESTGVVNPRTEKLFILGGDVDVDKFIVKTRSNVNDVRAEQTAMKVKSARMRFQHCFIKGDSATNPLEFDGLEKRLTGTQIVEAADNGLNIVGDGTAAVLHAFFDKVDELIAAVKGGPPDALYMNAAVLGKFRSAARRVGGWQQQKDEFGRWIEMYNGVRLADIGQNYNGTDIITQDETQGTSDECSSIYAVRFGRSEGDQAVTGLTNGGVMVDDLGEVHDKPCMRTRIEFYCGVAVFGRAAARLVGVKAA